MFLDYFRFGGPGDTPFAVDFIPRVIFVGVFALILVILGSKFRRPLGPAAALVYGLIVLLYNHGFFRF